MNKIVPVSLIILMVAALSGCVSTPKGPTGVIATATSSSTITINWNPSPGATGYTIYRSTSYAPYGPAYITLGTVTVPSFTDTDLSAGTTYYYIIIESNNAGRSAPSNPPEPPTTAPAAPTNVSAQARTINLIDLSWTPSTGATVYSIVRSTSSSGQYYKDSGDLVGGTISSFTDTGLSAGTTYYYEIIASNVGGESAPSNPPASATTYSIHDCQVNPQRC
jgi:fibronectin type 3 domain-containing protein